ncbi:unnamed protein product [Calicophoron daubneyi]|uniref:EGF-like domain-containing protein n=1 Tax=Calicophoron daubneyi TaxID=300641 RepID=A0AAV2TB82_CALDB
MSHAHTILGTISRNPDRTHNGTMRCHSVDEDRHCPKLDCERRLQVRVKDKCCKVCKKIDYCIQKHRLCDPIAKCLPTENGYLCQCPRGYAGSGRLRRLENGSAEYQNDGCRPTCEPACQNNGLCTKPNLCQCVPGFIGPNCQFDINECNLGLHRCTQNASCLNLPGSYACTCKPGFGRPAVNGNYSLTRKNDLRTRETAAFSVADMMDPTGSLCQEQHACSGREDAQLKHVRRGSCIADRTGSISWRPMKNLDLLKHLRHLAGTDTAMVGTHDCLLTSPTDSNTHIVIPDGELVPDLWTLGSACPICQCHSARYWCPGNDSEQLIEYARLIPFLTSMNVSDWPTPKQKQENILYSDQIGAENTSCFGFMLSNTKINSNATPCRLCDEINSPYSRLPYTWRYDSSSNDSLTGQLSICFCLHGKKFCRRLRMPSANDLERSPSIETDQPLSSGFEGANSNLSVNLCQEDDTRRSDKMFSLESVNCFCEGQMVKCSSTGISSFVDPSAQYLSFLEKGMIIYVEQS